MTNDELLLEVARLLLFSIDGRISKEQFAELETLLSGSPLAREYYFDLLLVTVGLNEPEGMLSLKERDAVSPAHMNLFSWQALAEYEMNAPAVAAEKPPRKITETDQAPEIGVIPKQRTVSRFSIYTLLFSAAAALCIIAMILFTPQSSPVAVLTDVIDAEWADTDRIPSPGQSLRPGALTLSAGFAELALNDGAVVVVEAPAVFNLRDSNRIFLQSGKLSAAVPKEAAGFTVQTANADIVDYGTEFGVTIENNGSVATHVFAGKVKVSSTKRVDGLKMSSWLTKDEAVSVDKDGMLSPKYISHARSFVQRMDLVKAWASYLDENLIQNPGFEKDTAGSYRPGQPVDQQITNVDIRDWTDNSVATVYAYNAAPPQESSLQDQEFPRPGRHSVPDKCGRNFFVGVDSNEVYQDIDVTELAYLINGSGVSFTLSGWLGGFVDHEDSLSVSAVFRNDRGEVISESGIGPVDPSERNNTTGFVFRTSRGSVPADTESIRIVLRTKRETGIADAYADNLELRLFAKGRNSE